MSRVLITGGAGTVGAAIARRLLSDPAYELRVSDRRPVPQWMREGCELHTGDLRVPREARAATSGCTHVIHLAATVAGDDPDLPWRGRPHTLMETRVALDSAVIVAAVEQELERFLYVSSAAVFERASEFPTTEAHLADCPAPASAEGFSMLAGERRCRAAHVEHGLPYTICRPFDPYGPGLTLPACGAVELAARDSDELRRTPTHVDDIADGTIAAMGSAAAIDEDFNVAAARELTVAEIARIVRAAGGEDCEELMLERLPADTGPSPCAGAVERRWPSVEKAKRLLGWQARIDAEQGIAATVQSMRARGSVGSAT